MNGGQCGQSPKVAPTVAIDERAEFEKWANENKGGETLQLGGGGTYPNPFANAAFEAWQARAKLSAPVVPDEKLLLEAIARGWCHEANSHKEVDASLVVAIAMEVKAMLKGGEK